MVLKGLALVSTVLIFLVWWTIRRWTGFLTRAVGVMDRVTDVVDKTTKVVDKTAGALDQTTQLVADAKKMYDTACESVQTPSKWLGDFMRGSGSGGGSNGSKNTSKKD